MKRILGNLTWKKLIASLLGILLVGIAVSFNANASLGNDPVGIVYDGVRNSARLTQQQLGTASNLVNLVLIVLVFLTGRRYINVGTFIYILPYGFFVDLGGFLYRTIFLAHPGLSVRSAAAVCGCLLLYIGVGLFVAADIGLDPFTGIVMVLADRTGKEYRKVKVVFDVCCTILGFVLGGTFGAVTVASALTAGPCIQFFSGKFKPFIQDEKKSTEQDQGQLSRNARAA